MKSVCFALVALCLMVSAPAGAVVVTVTPVTNNTTGVTGVVENQLTDS